MMGCGDVGGMYCLYSLGFMYICWLCDKVYALVIDIKIRLS